MTTESTPDVNIPASPAKKQKVEEDLSLFVYIRNIKFDQTRYYGPYTAKEKLHIQRVHPSLLQNNDGDKWVEVDRLSLECITPTDAIGGRGYYAILNSDNDTIVGITTHKGPLWKWLSLQGQTRDEFDIISVHRGLHSKDSFQDMEEPPKI